VAFKIVLYFAVIFLLVGSISYSESIVSSSIQATATVVQPIGLSSYSVPEFTNHEIEYNSDIQLLLLIPHHQSAFCLIETIDGQKIYYLATKNLMPVALMDGKSDLNSTINQITLIFTEN